MEVRLIRRFSSDQLNGRDYRTQPGLNKDTPLGRPVQRRGKITSMPELGGLHDAYVRI